jgi:hypothetical protein
LVLCISPIVLHAGGSSGSVEHNFRPDTAHPRCQPSVVMSANRTRKHLSQNGYGT